MWVGEWSVVVDINYANVQKVIDVIEIECIVMLKRSFLPEMRMYLHRLLLNFTRGKEGLITYYMKNTHTYTFNKLLSSYYNNIIIPSL